MAFALSLYVPHLFVVWCLGQTVLRDCGISWLFSFMFLCLRAYSRVLCFEQLHSL